MERQGCRERADGSAARMPQAVRERRPSCRGQTEMAEILKEILGLARVHTVLLVLILFAALYLCWEDWRW